MAERTYPTINNSRNTLCKFGCLAVSKMLSKINPAVPRMANAIVRPPKTLWPRDVLGTRRPRCRNQRSAANDRSRNTVVSTQPVMNRGLRLLAPTSLM